MALPASPHPPQPEGHHGGARWPYRVVAITSPSARLTLCSRRSLLQHGIDFHPLPDAMSALSSLVTENAAAVLVPTDVAGVTPKEFVTSVAASSEVPVLVGLTAEETSHVLGFDALEAGARGLIALPFDARQLTQTIQHLGSRQAVSTPPLSYGAITLEPEAHRVTVLGTVLQLSQTEFLVVEHLVNEAPRIATVTGIARAIGVDSADGSAARVRKCVQTVRRKLDVLRPGQPQLIETVPGVGYRLATRDRSVQ